jgi:hypothetical protein
MERLKQGGALHLFGPFTGSGERLFFVTTEPLAKVVESFDFQVRKGGKKIFWR